MKVFPTLHSAFPPPRTDF